MHVNKRYFSSHRTGLRCLNVISWKHSFKRLNEEYEIAKKKKQALDNLYSTGRISQATRDSFNNDISSAIVEIERQQKDLLEKMQLKTDELAGQIKTLETLLANYEIQHVVGEIEEGTYERELLLLSTSLDTAKNELDVIKTATMQLCAPVQTIQAPAAPEIPVAPAPIIVESVTIAAPEPVVIQATPEVAPTPAEILTIETPAPIEQAPVEVAPAIEAPVEAAPVIEAAPIEAPVEAAVPVETAQIEAAPIVEAPVIVESAPVIEVPVIETPVVEAAVPVEEVALAVEEAAPIEAPVEPEMPVAEPTIELAPEPIIAAAETAPVIEEPVLEAAPVEAVIETPVEAAPAIEVPAIEEAAPVEIAAAIETPLEETALVIEEAAPIEIVAPVIEAAVETVAPVEEVAEAAIEEPVAEVPLQEFDVTEQAPIDQSLEKVMEQLNTPAVETLTVEELTQDSHPSTAPHQAPSEIATEAASNAHEESTENATE